MRELAEGTASWALPAPCLHEFLAIVTHERIFSPPSPLPKALEQISAWLESPTLVVLSETASYWDVLGRVVERAKITGPRIHDGRIAALCSSSRRARTALGGPGLQSLCRAENTQPARRAMSHLRSPLLGLKAAGGTFREPCLSKVRRYIYGDKYKDARQTLAWFHA